jgi:hypothetical protein
MKNKVLLGNELSQDAVVNTRKKITSKEHEVLLTHMGHIRKNLKKYKKFTKVFSSAKPQ